MKTLCWSANSVEPGQADLALYWRQRLRKIEHIYKHPYGPHGLRRQFAMANEASKSKYENDGLYCASIITEQENDYRRVHF